jgi:hypothetical protein
MRIFTFLFFALLLGSVAKAQTVATFETLQLPAADTNYINYSNFGNDVGFDDGLAHFPCLYDTAFNDTLWSAGFVYSNRKTDTSLSYMNDRIAVTQEGYNGSTNYLVSFVNIDYTTFQPKPNKIHLKGKAVHKPVNGFYITNAMYAYKAILRGYFAARPFTRDSNDYFKVTVRGYLNGQLKNDSVDVFLADYRQSNTTGDTLVNTWKWVNLLPLGDVDSLEMTMASTDAGMFGINTPTYFCMDNFSTYETSSVQDAPSTYVAKVYPNPVVNELYVELKDRAIRDLFITDMTGKVVIRTTVKEAVTLISTAQLAKGSYVLNLVGEGKTASSRFVKY